MAGKGNPKTGGRKKGSVNRRTRYLSSVAAKAGLTPAEYLFGVLRDAAASVERRDWAAATLAPYVHPRLASVEQKVAATTEVRISRAQLAEQARREIAESFREWQAPVIEHQPVDPPAVSQPPPALPEEGNKPPREYALPGEPAPEVSRLPTHYRRPRPIGGGWSG